MFLNLTIGFFFGLAPRLSLNKRPFNNTSCISFFSLTYGLLLRLPPGLSLNKRSSDDTSRISLFFSLTPDLLLRLPPRLHLRQRRGLLEQLRLKLRLSGRAVAGGDGQ